ncbi:MAG: ribosome biogenesis GTP-binding protein YihA/YsxC [Desulfobacterota bacterium]|nr:ribosome biogenesis GTP-binding protein YihA/YsxC [Thermodesulfobacteriota bacterium]
MKVTEVQFIKSVFSPSELPRPGLPEIALCGRSNVGKSSMINVLLHRRIAKTSATPGRTQSINFILVNRSFFFVDLPGYGYARVPERIRQGWRILIESYLAYRTSLRCVVLIVDARRTPEHDEISLTQWFALHTIPWVVAVTKIDKLAHQHYRTACTKWHQALRPAATFAFSSLTGYGIHEAWKTIGTFLENKK